MLWTPNGTTTDTDMGILCLDDYGRSGEGVFCALYSDRWSHFWLTPKVGGKVDYYRPTQVGRALHALGVQIIPAYSPQARGRSERNFSTWQGRSISDRVRQHIVPSVGNRAQLSFRVQLRDQIAEVRQL